jgi:gamma-glutamyltranspeptidase/glutathione hydrolase
MTHGVISAAQPEAVEAGALALMSGGNAVDAAICCALVQGVIDPLMTGIGGVGSAIVHVPQRGAPENFNFLGAAPAAATEDMWSDGILGEAGDAFGFVLKGHVNALGHQAVMIPGNLKGYHEIHSAFGHMDWADICTPAIEYAENGWMVRPHVYTYATQDSAALGRVNNSDILGFSPYGRKLYLASDGNIKRPGEIIRNPDLAATLRTISREGAEAFYRGEIAERIASDMALHGGLITAEDLANYRVTRQPVLTGSYRGFELATNRPGGSGVQVMETLNILENFDLGSMALNSPEYIRILAEAIAYAYNEKRRYVGDPNFVHVPLDEMLDKAHAAELAQRIRNGHIATIDRLPAPKETRGTTQVCTVDEDGIAVTMTHTLGAPSGVIPPGGGFILNGCMGIFDPRPGRAMSIAPGKTYTSSMSPTMVFNKDRKVLVIGAPGATYIPQAVTQAIVNVLDFDMGIKAAVAEPRIAVTTNRTIDVSNRIPCFVTRQLETLGYAINRSYLSYAFAGVHGIRIADGTADGGADPGRDGMALAV